MQLPHFPKLKEVEIEYNPTTGEAKAKPIKLVG